MTTTTAPTGTALTCSECGYGVYRIENGSNTDAVCAYPPCRKRIDLRADVAPYLDSGETLSIEGQVVYVNAPTETDEDGDPYGIPAPVLVVTTLTGVKSSDLRAGDVVLTHGMRVRIPEPRIIPDTDCGAGPTVTVRGTVENPTDVRAAGTVPWAWLTEDDPDGTPRWTVQGNDLARWTVERA